MGPWAGAGWGGGGDVAGGGALRVAEDLGGRVETGLGWGVVVPIGFGGNFFSEWWVGTWQVYGLVMMLEYGAD